MARVYCKKHKCLIIVYPDMKTNKWKSNSRICNCKFNKDIVFKNRVYMKIRYFLSDGTEIKKVRYKEKWIEK